MKTKPEAWAALNRAAIRSASAEPGDLAVGKGLHHAAIAYATACGHTRTGPTQQARTASETVLPFGRSKGVPIGEAKTPDLEWVAKAVRESLDDPERARFREKNLALLAEIEKELEMR